MGRGSPAITTASTPQDSSGLWSGQASVVSIMFPQTHGRDLFRVGHVDTKHSFTEKL